MKSITTDLKTAAIVSSMLVLPFVILEFLFNTVNKQNALGLILLFGLLMLLPMVFIVILMPLVRTLRAGNNLLANPINIFKVASLALIAIIWGWGLIDQIPCFLGVPNCD